MTYMGGHTCISKRNKKTSHGTAAYRYSNCLFLLIVHLVSLLADEITAFRPFCTTVEQE